jgi:hypothetical protein
MPLGIDANGRSLRTCRESAESEAPRFSIVGVPPIFDNEGFVWNNRLAADPTMSCCSIPLEHAWERIAHLDPTGEPARDPLCSDGSKARLDPACAIADAVIQNTGSLGTAGLPVLAVPNHLDETGQDQVLEAFQSHGVFNIRLLWRPVALALDWAYGNSLESATFSGGKRKLCIVDMESRGLEVTLLTWQRHELDPTYVCPVRSYPRRKGYYCRWMSWQWAEQIASGICGTEGDPKSLLSGLSGDDFQRQLEDETPRELLYQLKADPRRWMECEMRQPDATRVKKWAEVVAGVLPNTLRPSDVILLHGWPARHLMNALKSGIPQKVIRSNPDAVARGAWLFADRLANKRPTYYDILPQYAIWVSSNDAVGNLTFGWKPLNEEEKVIDAGESWRLSAQHNPELVALRNGGLRLARYIDRFSLLIQNKTVFDEDNAEGLKASHLIAKRLAADLPTMTREEKELELEVVIAPASGNARFSIRGRDANPLFGDTNEVELSWKTAEDEPEHKGYLEAREVVGRIMDKPEYREMARLITRQISAGLGSPQDRTRLQRLLADYRSGPFDFVAAGDDALLGRVLEPWGYNANPSQPTRGLWGSRRVLNDPELDAIASGMGAALLARAEEAGWASEDDYKFLNYMFIYAPCAFIERIRGEFTIGHGAGHVRLLSQVYAPGRVLSHADEYGSFVCFTNTHGFDNNRLRAAHWWSLFRCLCYHKLTAQVDVKLISEFLEMLCRYYERSPCRIQNERKYALHALLFCLRMREPRRGSLDSADTFPFLHKGDPLRDRFNTLIGHGPLAGQEYPPSMLAGMPNLVQPGDNFSEYVRRFLNEEDTLLDREMGSGLATS